MFLFLNINIPSCVAPLSHEAYVFHYIKLFSIFIFYDIYPYCAFFSLFCHQLCLLIQRLFFRIQFSLTMLSHNGCQVLNQSQVS